MIITDKFVLLNFPKTGSTFARQAIADLYQKRQENRGLLTRVLEKSGLLKSPLFLELYLPRTEFRDGYNSGVDQHGRYEQVPEQFKSKPVISVVRDPLNRNISFYEYGWWKDHAPALLEDIRREFPAFPDMDFRTYLDYQNFNTRYRDTGVAIPDDIGAQTVHFIQFFFKDPHAAFRKLNDEYIYSGAYKNDLPEISLLKSEQLNRQLYDYLLACGFTPVELDFINSKTPVRPEATLRKSDEERKQYLSADIVSLVRHRERYLYRIYADFGNDYRD